MAEDEGLERLLADSILPLLEGAGAEKYFLLVSTDFCHHRDAAATARSDSLSRRFFANPGMGTRALAGCDNAPGMFVLSALAEANGRAACILHHATSLDIAPGIVNPADVTSYFFSFMYRPPPLRDGQP